MVKYPISKQIGNKGEAFFESLISNYALVHKIDGSKDVGLDFLCEWIFGEHPTRLLFGVQVKTRKRLKIIKRRDKSRLNHLEEFKIKLEGIKKTTLDYWSGFDFPVFLFLVHLKEKTIDCFYKRYTTIVQKIDKENKMPFF